MTQVQAFLETNKKYLPLDSDSAVAISQVPDAAWPFILEALDEHSGGATDPGIDCAVAITRETLADFDASRANNWSERGTHFRPLPRSQIRALPTSAWRSAPKLAGNRPRRVSGGALLK